MYLNKSQPKARLVWEMLNYSSVINQITKPTKGDVFPHHCCYQVTTVQFKENFTDMLSNKGHVLLINIFFHFIATLIIRMYSCYLMTLLYLQAHYV